MNDWVFSRGVNGSGDGLGEAMKRIFFGFSVIAFVLMFGAAARGQQPGQVPRVVWLTTGPPSIIAARVEAFR